MMSSLEKIKSMPEYASFSEKDLARFAHFCDSTGLDPVTKEAYMATMRGKTIIEVTLAGKRRKALESGKYLAGRPKYLVKGGGGWLDYYDGSAELFAVRWEVKRAGSDEWSAFDVFVSDYAWKAKSGGEGAWNKHFLHMLKKVAESHAISAFFADEINGAYIAEEMRAWNADEEDIQSKRFVFPRELDFYSFAEKYLPPDAEGSRALELAQLGDLLTHEEILEIVKLCRAEFDGQTYTGKSLVSKHLFDYALKKYPEVYPKDDFSLPEWQKEKVTAALSAKYRSFDAKKFWNETPNSHRWALIVSAGLADGLKMRSCPPEKRKLQTVE